MKYEFPELEIDTIPKVNENNYKSYQENEPIEEPSFVTKKVTKVDSILDHIFQSQNTFQSTTHKNSIMSKKTMNSSDECISIEKCLESPILTEKKCSRPKSNTTQLCRYNVDEILGESDELTMESKNSKSSIFSKKKISFLATEETNSIEINEDLDEKKLKLIKFQREKEIELLSLSTSTSMSLDDNDDQDHDRKKIEIIENIWQSNTQYHESCKENLLHNSNLVEKDIDFESVNEKENDAGKIKLRGTEWLKEISENNYDDSKFSGGKISIFNPKSVDTSQTSLAPANSNLFLSESDIKRKKLKFIK